MKVVVTGGAGFIGSHLVDYLLYKNLTLKVVDTLEKRKANNIKQHFGKPNFSYEKANLMDYKETLKCLEGSDVVIHLAAKIGGIGYFHRYPADIIADNDLINRNIFKASVENNVKKIIYTSSSMVFERANRFPLSEDIINQCPPPKSAYGFQKLNGEYYCRAFYEQYGLNYVIIRPFNAVGPREYPGKEVGEAHVIPDLVRKILELKQDLVEILGDGEQIRCFTNVRDIVRAYYLTLVKRSALNNDFNIGTTEETTINELAKMIWELAGRKGKIKFKYLRPFEKDVQKRIPDITKAKRILGWEPHITLYESLKEYIDWYKEEIL